MIRRCKPIIWCCVNRGTEYKYQEKLSCSAIELNLCIRIVICDNFSNIEKRIKNLKKSPLFSKNSDTIAMLIPLSSKELNMALPQNVKSFPTFEELLEWLQQKYSTNND
ncbi:hypothetical protein [Desulfitobacterium sp.]|uniref:hypothetical protein n=1 Tax=Desulfitobacterium sp. TaxID=49981 RepID=UPI002B216F96|nr:hypothetical protein [Desulfitobacterium sp.]MEA4902371.1 hypothetical protein [Desulfitobacterium sp.]